MESGGRSQRGGVMKRYAIAVVAGLLPAVVWSLGMSPGLLMMASVMGLLVAVKGGSPRQGRFVGWAYGLVLYGVSLSWMWHIFGGLAIVLWLVLAMFLALCGGLIAWGAREYGQRWFFPLMSAVTWTAVEYFRCEWFVLRFPWMTPGTAMGPVLVTPWLGVYGVSFLVVLAAAIAVQRWHRGWRMAAVLGMVGLIAAPVSFIDDSEQGAAVKVMAIQSENVDFYTYYERSLSSGFRDGVIIWPEYSCLFDARVERAGKAQTALLTKIQELAAQANSLVIFGQKTVATDGLPYNEALMVDRSGIRGSHFKNRPVHLMQDGAQGTMAVPHESAWGKIATPICFDNDYTEVTRRMVAAGAEVLISPTMDAEHWSERQHRQHAELFRLRAAETGRYVVVCASSGMTQVIGPDGQRLKELPLMQDGILETTVHLRHGQTFYVRYGWAFPWLLCALFALMMLGGLVEKWNRAREFRRRK